MVGEVTKGASSTTLPQDILDDIIQRVVEIAEPESIILFGSAAKGEMNANSDVDLLIVVDTPDERALAMRIYRRLYGVGASVDAVVVTPNAVERYKDSHSLIIKPALKEGRIVYTA